MNFDQLKKDWNAADESSSAISPALLNIKEARTPVDRLRKKMRREFDYQLVGLVILALCPFTLNFPAKIIPVFFAFYSVLCGFTTYYFYKFYKFYKSGYDLSLDSRKNLLWFYYEMKMNVELYKALSYILAFICLSFAAVALLMLSDQGAAISRKFTVPVIMVSSFLSILMIGLFTELWAKYYYGKELSRLKTIIDTLDDE